MADKKLTQTEREELWIKAREILVEHNIMKPNGEPTSEETKKTCLDFRRLFLTKE